MTNKPSRIQLSRKKGWRKPAGVVTCARPTKWGNPFPLADFEGEDDPRQVAMETYRQWIFESAQADLRRQMKQELRGKDLACWCSLSLSCHVDTILEIANG